MRKISDYDRKKIITLSESLKQKKFYEIREDYKKTIVSLIDGLSIMDFRDKLYEGVTKGSKRWWVLERRKFDFNKFKSKNNHKIFPKKEIKQHESEWENKVKDFYSYIEKGYVESSSIGVETKAPSSYMLKKYYDDKETISFDDARNIGLNEKREPIYYKVIINEDGKLADVKCNVTLDNIKNEPKIKKFTKRWWVLKRMQFDFGDKYRPLLKGQEPGDWKGVKYKFGYYYSSTPVEFIERHEMAWDRYVTALFDDLNVVHTELSLEEKVKHNSNVLSMMENVKFNSLIIDYPLLVISHCPTYLYSPILNFIIEKLVADRRIVPKGQLTIDEVVKPLKKMISNFIHVQYPCCERITITYLQMLVYHNQNCLYTIVQFLIYQSILLGMVRREYVDALKNSLNKFKVQSIELNTNDLSLEEQLSFFNLDKPIIEFKETEEYYEKFCKENGLYNI